MAYCHITKGILKLQEIPSCSGNAEARKLKLCLQMGLSNEQRLQADLHFQQNQANGAAFSKPQPG